MEFTEILARLTGISTPIFGVSWNPPEAQVTVARRIIAKLEDRCALYNSIEAQDPEYCVESIIEIRRDILTPEIAQLDTQNELTNNLRAMRAACRRFLDKVERRPNVPPGERPYWVTDGTLG